MILEQIAAGEARVENEYIRAVKPGGNPEALKLFDEVFRVCDEAWRGIGVIPGSGFGPAEKYKRFDAREAHGGRDTPRSPEPRGAAAARSSGRRSTRRSASYSASACNPVHPIGPCMVSREGSCSAHYKYRRQTAS